MEEMAEFDLKRSPGHMLHRAQQYAADRFNEATGGETITQRQFAVLCAMHANEGLTQIQLVKDTGIDRSTLAELVARMEAKGLIVRERAPGDARANSISFTDAGRALYETVIAGAIAADRAILSTLPKNKRANFLDALSRISRAIEIGEEALKEEAKKAKAKKKAAAKKAKAKAKTKKKKKARKKKKDKA